MSRLQTILYNSKPCLDPRSLYRELIDRNLPVDTWFGKANSFICPLGESPGTGTILLTERQVNELSGVTSDASLEFIDSGTPVTLQKIVFIHSECVTPTDDGNLDAVHVCHLADRRWHLAKVPINKAYNLRMEDGTDYETATKNAGTAWTWTQMVSDIWTDAGLTSYPGLPFTPHGTPENFDFYGSFAWYALNHVLTRLACAVKYNPITDAFSIIRLGSNTSTQSAAITALERDTGQWVWDEYPVAAVRAGQPEKIRVLFEKLPVPTDGTATFSTEDVTLAATTGVVSGTYVTLHDDLSSLSGNAATRTARAAERAADWLRRYQYFEYPYARVYDGFHGTKAMACLGETIGTIAWSDRGKGGRTELIAGPDDSYAKWTVRSSKGGGSGSGSAFPCDAASLCLGGWATRNFVTDVSLSCTAGTLTLTVTKHGNEDYWVK